MKLEILEKKKPKRTADLFYDRPYEATAKDGRVFSVHFCGEVRFEWKGDQYYENTIHKAMRDDDFNDEALQDIEFESNGWLEIDANCMENENELPIHIINRLDGYDIAGDYDDGLELLKRVVEDYESDFFLDSN